MFQGRKENLLPITMPPVCNLLCYSDLAVLVHVCEWYHRHLQGRLPIVLLAEDQTTQEVAKEFISQKPLCKKVMF